MGAALVQFCSEFAIDVRPDQGLKCIGNLGVFVSAALSTLLRKISVRHDVFEQLFVRAVGQA